MEGKKTIKISEPTYNELMAVSSEGVKLDTIEKKVGHLLNQESLIWGKNELLEEYTQRILELEKNLKSQKEANQRILDGKVDPYKQKKLDIDKEIAHKKMIADTELKKLSSATTITVQAIKKDKMPQDKLEELLDKVLPSLKGSFEVVEILEESKKLIEGDEK